MKELTAGMHISEKKRAWIEGNTDQALNSIESVPDSYLHGFAAGLAFLSTPEGSGTHGQSIGEYVINGYLWLLKGTEKELAIERVKKGYEGVNTIDEILIKAIDRVRNEG